MIQPAEGTIVGGVTVTAAGIDGVLQATARLARDVRVRLGDTLPALTRTDATLPKVRTQSFTALKLYAAALPDLYRDANPAVARQLLVDALKQDPDFTLAHIALARAIWEQRQAPPAPQPDDEINACLDRASALVVAGDAIDRHIVETESGHLRGLLAAGVERRPERRRHFEEALKAAELWHRLQPSSERAIEMILALHTELNRPPSSDVPLVRKLVELRPNSLEALRRAAGRSSLARNFAEARAYLARAKPLLDLPETGSNSRRAALDVRTWLIDDAWVRGDLREALQISAELRAMLDAAEPAAASFYAPTMMFMYLVLGQLDRAEDAASRITHDDRLRRLLTLSILKHRGDMQRLRDEIPRAFPDAWLAASPGLAGLRADVAIHMGRLQTARAALNDMRRYGTNAENIPWIEARLALAEGKPEAVIKVLATVVAPRDNPFITQPESDRAILLAKAFSMAGQPEEAIRTLDTVSSRRREIRHPGINGAPYWMSLRDYLAQLYREAGRAGDAEPIEAELRNWLAAADHDHPIVRRIGQGAHARIN
jgi:hypothetical protein